MRSLDHLLAESSPCTPELRQFISAFLPLSLKTKDGAKLRKAGFKHADPNGTTP